MNDYQDQYINDNFIQDVKKYTKDQFILQYQFGYQIKKDVNIKINCDIINNFSVSHSGTLDSNGYIVFCNLENKDTLELLEKIVEYIKENCSLNIKTYVIGVFEDNIDEDKTYMKMQSFLSGLDFEFEYYEMFLGKKDMFKIISKEHENALIMEETFKNVFKEIYEGGKGPRFYKKDVNYNTVLSIKIDASRLYKILKQYINERIKFYPCPFARFQKVPDRPPR